ncbi:MAG: NAD(+) diphosphatase [Thermoleophilaceae bacterium]
MTRINTFAGAAIDRAAERRTDERWLAERLEDPGSRALAVTDDGVLVDGDRAARFPLTELGHAEPVFLGVEPDGRALFAVAVDAPRDGARVVGVREAGALLSQSEGGLVAYAAGTLNWHRRHPHCAVCGAGTETGEGGHVRRCPRCGTVHHPRTDPVVIMLVTDGQRVLLGRQPTWPPGRYSALAGFVEPGESLEEAVAREVLEEAGVEVRDVRYVSSQPWPFPSSLMLGFTASYAGGEAAVRDAELDDVRWFTRDELRDVDVPPPLAIARRLIDGWRGD